MPSPAESWMRATVAVVLSGCAQASSKPEDVREMTLRIAAASGFRDVCRLRLLPGFADHWKARHGVRPKFEESYASSGSLIRSIDSGFDADVALLMSVGDLDRLAKSNILRQAGSRSSISGIIARGRVVIGVRPGNPKQIRSWDDLARDDVGVILADPRVSGGSRWNIFAIWGAAQLRDDGSTASARDLLAGITRRVVTFESSSRLSLAAFARGAGDTVVTAESELHSLRTRTGVAYETVVPARTLRMDLPGCLIEVSVEKHGNRAVAEEFFAYLNEPEAQAAFQEFGFAAMEVEAEAPTRFDTPTAKSSLFTIEELGGWPRLNDEIFGETGVWDGLFIASNGRGTAR